MAKHKRYGKDFQLETAKLVVEHGYTLRAAAERLGVTEWSIRQWIKRFRQSGELPPEGTVVPEAEEFRRLHQENKRLLLENEILKKAAAYFAKESL